MCIETMEGYEIYKIIPMHESCDYCKFCRHTEDKITKEEILTCIKCEDITTPNASCAKQREF